MDLREISDRMEINELLARYCHALDRQDWPAYRALGDIPVLILRGQLSDILSKPAAKKMAAALPGARLVEVPRVGHAPTMDEAKARAAIDAWIGELAAA